MHGLAIRQHLAVQDILFPAVFIRGRDMDGVDVDAGLVVEREIESLILGEAGNQEQDTEGRNERDLFEHAVSFE
jgi:hypothetical protein